MSKLDEARENAKTLYAMVKEDGVLNVIAERIEKLNLGLRTKSRDFR